MTALEPGRDDATPVPDLLPVLSRGQHRSPARGACFMEYTSLLAGGPFTDRPPCVDGELGDVLRGANDKLSDADRPLLVPLLGRAIGLAVEPPPPRPRGLRATLRHHREVVTPYRAQTARLHQAVARRFVAALGRSPLGTGRAWYGGSGELSQLFWDAMSEPVAPSGSPEYVRRLVERLRVLHECYEQAMDDLGLPRPAGVRPVRPVSLPVADPTGEQAPASA
ncbi:MULTISPECIES: hypothetical protein [unclassified Blastococcus]